MRTAMLVLACGVWLTVAAFCLFGFLASFEPSATPGGFLAYRVGYGVVGGTCVIGALLTAARLVRG